METTHIETTRSNGAALSSLAIVGFVALIIIGIIATIYAASFIPKLLTGGSQSGGAAAYLSTLNDTPANDAPPATVTATTTTVSTSPLTPTEPATAPVTNTVTNTVYRNVYVPTPVAVTPTYSGLADLTITTIDKGYLTSSNIGSFVSSNTVPAGYNGAVKYRITNIGSNVSGSYRVDIRVDAPGGTDNESVTGGSLTPGRSVEGVGSFDTTSGGTATIRLSVDAGNNISESNENNNTDVTTISVNGTSYNNTFNSNTSSYDSNGSYCSNGTYYSGSRYFCNSSTGYSNNTNTSSYDSNGSYCVNGTYSQNGRTYCNQFNSNNNTSYSRNSDTNGNYCPYGVFQSGNSYYCNSSNSNTNVYYNNRDSACVYGSYQVNGTYYCY